MAAADSSRMEISDDDEDTSKPVDLSSEVSTNRKVWLGIELTNEWISSQSTQVRSTLYDPSTRLCYIVYSCDDGQVWCSCERGFSHNYSRMCPHMQFTLWRSFLGQGPFFEKVKSQFTKNASGDRILALAEMDESLSKYRLDVHKKHIRLHQYCVYSGVNCPENMQRTIVLACVSCGSGYCESCVSKAREHNQTSICPGCRGENMMQWEVSERDLSIRDLVTCFSNFGIIDDRSCNFLNTLSDSTLEHSSVDQLLFHYFDSQVLEPESLSVEECCNKLGFMMFRTHLLCEIWERFEDRFSSVHDMINASVYWWGSDATLPEYLERPTNDAKEIEPGKSADITYAGRSVRFCRLLDVERERVSHVQMETVDPKYLPGPAEGWTRFYHGTSINSASIIVYDGVTLQGRAHLDFNTNAAFYVGNNFYHACSWRNSKAVVVFDVCNADIHELRWKIFSHQDPQLREYVLSCRKLIDVVAADSVRVEEWDIVTGPTLHNLRSLERNPSRQIVWVPNLIQSCFLTTESIRILNDRSKCTVSVILL